MLCTGLRHVFSLLSGERERERERERKRERETLSLENTIYTTHTKKKQVKKITFKNVAAETNKKWKKNENKLYINLLFYTAKCNRSNIYEPIYYTLIKNSI